MSAPRVLAAALVAVGAFLASPSTPTGAPASVHASVSVAVTLDELVQHSQLAIVGQAVEARSVWETVAGGRRIVTYTRIESPEVAYGDAPRELWVRTLGGSVGRIGQQVSGEPRLSIGARHFLFLTKTPDGRLVVTARAQGHYRLVRDDAGAETLEPSPDVGTVVPRARGERTARDELVGRALAPAISLVSARRERHHEPR